MKLKKIIIAHIYTICIFKGSTEKWEKHFWDMQQAVWLLMTDTFNFQGSPLLYLTSVLLYVTSVISPVFYITDYSMNQIFPFTPSSFLPFPPSFFPFLWIPGLRFLCPSSIFPIFPLHFPDVYACAHLPNARVNIIRCTPFRLSSYILENYVLQHPYNSTL